MNESAPLISAEWRSPWPHSSPRHKNSQLFRFLSANGHGLSTYKGEDMKLSKKFTVCRAVGMVCRAIYSGMNNSKNILARPSQRIGGTHLHPSPPILKSLTLNYLSRPGGDQFK